MAPVPVVPVSVVVSGQAGPEDVMLSVVAVVMTEILVVLGVAAAQAAAARPLSTGCMVFDS